MKSLKIFLFVIPTLLFYGISVSEAASTLTATSCAIAAGSSTCSVSLSWNAGVEVRDENLTFTGVKAFSTSSYSHDFSGYNGSSVSHIVPYGTVTYKLYYKDVLIENQTKTLKIGCASGSAWDATEGKCKDSGPIDPGTIVGEGSFVNSQSSCIISALRNNCTPQITYMTKGGSLASFAVTTYDDYTVSTSRSGVADATHTVNDTTHILHTGESRAYYLYSGGSELDVITIWASCAADTVWNGSICSPGSFDITDNSTYTISSGESVIGVPYHFSWGSSTVPSPITSTKDNVIFTIEDNNEVKITLTGYDNINSTGSKWTLYNGNYQIHGPTTQTLVAKYDGKVLDSVTINSSCANLSGWNGVICSPARITSTPINSYYGVCVIGADQSSCPVKMDFSLKANPLYSITSVSGDGTNDITTIKASNNGSEANVPWIDNNSVWSLNNGTTTMIVNGKVNSYNVSFGDTTFNLFNDFKDTALSEYTARGSHLMASSTVRAVCEYGYEWNGTKCALPEGTFVVTPCQIKVGDSSCVSTFRWNVRNSNRGVVRSFIDNYTFAPEISNLISANIYSSENYNKTIRGSTTDVNTEGGYDFVSKKDKPVMVTLESVNHEGKFVRLASYYSDSPTCETGAMWSSTLDKCVAKVVPLSGSISSTPCEIKSESTCESILTWSTQQYQIDPNTLEIRKDWGASAPEKPSTIDVYRFGLYLGPLSITAGSNTQKIYINRAIEQNAVYKLIGHYVAQVGHPYSQEELIALCENGGGYLEPNTRNYCTFSVPLSEVKIDAVCPTGKEWDQDTSSCVSPFVKLSLIEATTKTSILTSIGDFIRKVSGVFSPSHGLRNSVPVKPATPVQIYWEARGFNPDTVQCTMPDNSVIKNWYGYYPEGNSINPTSTTTFSITCKD